MSVFSKIYEDKIQEIKNEELKRNKDTSVFINNICMTTVISSFEWENVPKLIRQIPDFIEESLFFFGQMGGFINDNGEFEILPCTRNGSLLENGLSSQYTLYYRNGKTVIKKYEDIELLFNNWSVTPSFIYVDEIAEKMTNALRAVDSALDRAKVPPLICSSKEELTNIITTALNNAYKNLTPYAIVNLSSAIAENITRIPLYDDKEQGIINLWDIFVRYKNLFFTTYGINNVEISKQERLTMAEGSANTEITRFGVFNDMYKHRKEFCKRVKEHFNYDLKVEINRNMDTVVELNMDNKEKIERDKNIIAPYGDQIENEKEEEKEEKEDEISD